MRSNFEITVDLSDLAEINRLLDGMPRLILTLNGPLDQAVKIASKHVMDRAKQLAPDSNKTKSRDKQTAGSKAAWYGKLKTTIRTKLIRHERGAWAVVGPKDPEGNMAYFMQETPRRHVLWGQSYGYRKYRIARNWIAQAFDETRSAQVASMESTLKSAMDEMHLQRLR